MREVIEEITTIELWTKFQTLYITKSLTNQLHLKHQLYTLRMKEVILIKDHLNEFNRVILDL
jgi:hypothetical protein